MKNSIISLLLLSVFLVGCSNDSQEPSNTQANKAGYDRSQNNSNNALEDILISDSNEQVIANILLYGTPLIEFDNQTIKSKLGSSGKRKYLNQNGQVLAKIKRDNNQKFKLKSENGTLLWKIKIKPDSIKVANNEEMQGSYKIKIKEPNRVKLLLNESEIGKANTSGKVTSVNAPKVNMNISNTKASHAGVMGFNDIPLPLRLIILAELSDSHSS